MQVNINKNQDVTTQDQKDETTEEEEVEQSQPTASLSNPQNNKSIDWDPDEGYARRLWARILEEKKQLGQEYLLINKEKELIAYERRNLELEKKQLDYDRRNLDARLQEVEKYRDILPSAKKLRDEMGVDFHEITCWIEVIMERSETERISRKAAITLIVQDLKSYNELNTIQKAIKERQQDLEVLNIAVEQTQQAYRSLVNLRSKGISDTEIIELNSLISSSGAGGSQEQNNRLNLRLDDKLNLASPNGKNKLQQPSNGNNSYDDGNLSMNDWIRLNLLKGSTTNMLNRIGTTSGPINETGDLTPLRSLKNIVNIRGGNSTGALAYLNKHMH